MVKKTININLSMYPKVLIVSTTPYKKEGQSRVLDTFFHNFPKDNLLQIFSQDAEPDNFNLCASYYRITDKELAIKLFKKKYVVGNFFNAFGENNNLNKKNTILTKLSNVFKKKNLLRFYLRNFLWKKKRWLSDKLQNCIDKFGPNLIYCVVSDDKFILDISLYFSGKYNIPVINAVFDDYYFIKNRNPLMIPYKIQYRKKFNNLMTTAGFCIYISDKMAEIYNSKFKKYGFPVYFNSLINQSNIHKIKYEFNYIGNIELKRYKSLALLGKILKKINSEYKLNIYCKKPSNIIVRYLKRNNCILKGFISFEQVSKIMTSGAFNIVASSFSKSELNKTRYSLSTKTADVLISNGPIIAIGPKEDGAIQYLTERNCAIIINEKKYNINKIKFQLEDTNYLKDNIKRANLVYQAEHNLEKNRDRFEAECFNLIKH